MSIARVLVTGAAGFFGLAIVRALSAVGHEVVATDRVPETAFIPREGSATDRLGYVCRDLGRERLDDLLDEVDAIVHTAALTPGGGESGPLLDALLDVNLGALLHILAAVRSSRRCRRVLYVSSAGVYRQDQDGVLAEDAATGGATLYGATKFAGELVLERFATQASLDWCAVRPTALYGPGESVRSSRPQVTSFLTLVEAARAGVVVQIERPEARRDWLHVDDAARAVMLLLSSAQLPGQALNLSSGVARPFSDVVDAVRLTAGLRTDAHASPVVSGGPDRPARIPHERLASATGWAPELGFADAIRALDLGSGTLREVQRA